MATKWKIDEVMPLAIIEDNDNGESVIELAEFGMGEDNTLNRKLAEYIVGAHNLDIGED